MANDGMKYISDEFFKISEHARKINRMFFDYCYESKIWDDDVYKSFTFYSQSIQSNLSSVEFCLKNIDMICSHADSFDCSSDENEVNRLVSSLR